MKKIINGWKKAVLIVSGWILIISLAFEPFASYSNSIGALGIISLVVGTLK